MSAKQRQRTRPTDKGKARKVKVGIDIPPRAMTEILQLMRAGGEFDAVCGFVGFYKAEVFDFLKRNPRQANDLTDAVETGRLADRCMLWMRMVETGHKSSVAMQVAGINATILHGRRKIDPEFALLSMEAEQRGTDHLEDIAMRRAMKGSDVLLMFLLKARDRARFADTPPQVAVVPDNLKVTVEQRHEFGRRIAFALRYAAESQAAGDGTGNGADPERSVVDAQRGSTNGSAAEHG